MKTTFKLGMFAVLLLTISCTKENPGTTSSSMVQVTAKQVLSFSIGQHYGGGIIFYIDTTGLHGLIVDTVDLHTATWYNPLNGLFILTAANGKKIGSGFRNTREIILSQGDSGKYAARECWRSKRSGYKDWFLPSRDELNELYLQRNVVGGIASNSYWSSSDGGVYQAWGQYFLSGFQIYYTKSNTYYVRAVRAF